MSEYILLNYCVYFLIYGFLGWIVEVVYTGILNKKVVNRGFLFSPFLPIYAFGAVLLISVLSNFVGNIVVLYIISVIVTTLIEYVVSVFLETFFHVKWWDYSNHHLNIHGRVCVKNSLLFGVLGVIVMFVIHPPIQTFVINLDIEVKKLVVDILFLVLIIDFYFTLKKLGKLSVRHIGSITGADKQKNQDAILPDLIHGKYSENRVSNMLLNIILFISIAIGIITMFLIDIPFGLIISFIFIVILYSTVNISTKKMK